MLKSYFF